VRGAQGFLFTFSDAPRGETGAATLPAATATQVFPQRRPVDTIRPTDLCDTGGVHMLLAILLLIAVVVLFGLGFVIQWLFYLAVILFLIWIVVMLVDRIRGKK
jgi:hypothetical protein